MKIPGFTLRGFRSPREVVGTVLGKLERQVMDEVWRREEVSVRDIFRAFDERMAYTTLMTTLDRLHKKGLLSRRKDGRAFLYSARVSPAEFEQGVASDVISSLLGKGFGDAEPVLACIVDAVSEKDRTLLDELDRLVKEKRRQLNSLD
jgi:predicted transcriptional regulator